MKLVSIKSELDALRALCHHDKLVSGTILASTDESYFYDDHSLEVYKAIKKQILETGEQPTFKSITEDPELSQTARDFFKKSTADIHTQEDAKKAAALLNKYRKVRYLYNMASNISQSFENNDVSIDKLIDQSSEMLMKARVTKSTEIEVLRFGYGNNSLSTIKDILFGENKDDLIPTGYKTYDDINGGLSRGGLTLIGGSTGAGKSVMAIDMAIKQAELGYRVVIVPLEMTKREVTGRMIANVTGTDALYVTQNHKLSPAEKDVAFKKMARWTKRVSKKGGAVYVYEPDRDIRIEEIYAEIATYAPDVVIIDYISLLAGADGDNQWLELGKFARLAKVNAKQTNRANILLCQVNQDGVVRYSRTMVEHANHAWVFVANQETKEAGILKIEQLKARNGRAFPFTLSIDYSKMRISDMAQGADVDMSLNNTMPEPAKNNLANDL